MFLMRTGRIQGYYYITPKSHRRRYRTVIVAAVKLENGALVCYDDPQQYS